MDLDTPLFETVKHVASDASGIRGVGGSSMAGTSHAPDVITITTDQGGLSKQLSAQMNAAAAAAAAQAAVNQQLAAVVATGGSGPGQSSGSTSKKRKRHIAIDVETERAKLHALLNSTQGN